MIKDYAIDPELVANIRDRREAQHWARLFGLGTPRLMSLYPNRKLWRRAVMRALPNDLGDVQRAGLLEFVESLLEVTATREGRPWIGEQDWLQNAEHEHAEMPFHALVAGANPRDACGVTLVRSILDEEVNDGVWRAPVSKVVERTVEAFDICVGKLLSCSREIAFVDPHFSAGLTRFAEPMVRFLCKAASGSAGASTRVAIVTGDQISASWHAERLSRQLVGTAAASLHILIRTASIDELHNRYILTELGGIAFGHGLDVSDDGGLDDVHILSRDQYERHWARYASPKPTLGGIDSVSIP